MNIPYLKKIIVEIRKRFNLYVMNSNLAIASEDDSIMIYALSSDYDPSQEFAVNPIDAELAINWPLQGLKFSERDLSAPTLKSFLSV